MFEEAIELAKLRDKERQEAIEQGSQDSLPEMHGIPMSFKDNIAQKGCLATVGTAHLCDQYFDHDGVIVKLFLKAGAIPMVRGNCPQSALSVDCMNFVWG